MFCLTKKFTCILTNGFLARVTGKYTGRWTDLTSALDAATGYYFMTQQRLYLLLSDSTQTTHSQFEPPYYTSQSTIFAAETQNSERLSRSRRDLTEERRGEKGRESYHTHLFTNAIIHTMPSPAWYVEDVDFMGQSPGFQLENASCARSAEHPILENIERIDPSPLARR